MDYAALEHGLMMDRQLSISAIIQHAEAQHGDVDIVSRETHGPLFRYSFADCARRSRRLANALAALGLKPGEHVATLAWNNHRQRLPHYLLSAMCLYEPNKHHAMSLLAAMW